MDRRRHIWHDPEYAPHEIVTEDLAGRAAKSVKSSARLRKTLWRLVWFFLGVVVLTVVGIFGSAVVAGVMDGIDDPLMYPLTEKEEAGVRGLATTIADRGKRGDFEAIAALADESPSVDESELASDVATAFGGKAIKDWEIDVENVQVLEDLKSKQRIVVFRLVLTGTDGAARSTNPLYAVEHGGVWRLTGIKGRDVREVLY